MARPLKPSHDRLSITLRVRLTPGQLGRVLAAAQAAQMELSPYVRAAVLQGHVTAPRVPGVNLSAIASLNRVGNNLNQLTRYFNAHPAPAGATFQLRLGDLLSILEDLKREMLGWSEK